MIKADSVIQQLQSVLPRYTDLFTDPDIAVSSLSRSGSTVTCVTGTVHNLATGRYMFVNAAKTPLSITSITRIGNIATVTTANVHDFTENFDMVAEITGADQSEYNGTFDIINVPNRFTFTYEVTGTPVTPATGTIFVLNDFIQGYNGRHQVTVIDPTTFTYQITQTPDSPAQGSPIIRNGLRVSGAVTMERAVDSYTEQNYNGLWGFVVLGDVFASKSRHTKTDATDVQAAGDAFRQKAICPFNIFVITPTADSISGRQARDLMEDVVIALLKSIARTKLPTNLSNGAQYETVFVGHGFAAFSGAYYIHQFQFETNADITYNDTVDPDLNVAFRDIHLDFLNVNETDNDNIIMTADINLDDEPV